MLRISNRISIPLSEIELSAIRAQGPGGQAVNKTSSAIHLRFDIQASSMPEWHKRRALKIRDKRLTANGVIVIKAQNKRSQERNKQDALSRLSELLSQAFKVEKRRIPTRESYGASKRGIKSNKIQKEKKAFRARIKPRDM